MFFPAALKKFSENGFFELKDSQICLEEIINLQTRINYLNEDNPDIPFYQFHLKNVELIPGPLPQAEASEQILSGVVVEHSSRAWKEQFTDVALIQMVTTNGLNTPLNFADREENREKQQADLKNALLILLSQPYTWNSIKLDSVFFQKNHPQNYSNERFQNDLLEMLAKYSGSLRELSLKPISLSNSRAALVNFLIQNSNLESLHLEITSAYRPDWLELTQVLAMHPKLKSLNLGNSVLESSAYSALVDLLDENYRVGITLTEPTDEDLLKAYGPLKRRLSKPGLERFKEGYLSQTKLLQVAITALESLQNLKSSPIEQTKEQALLEKQFDFLLDNQGHLAITNSEKEDWVKSTAVLPSIYNNHEEYLKSESPLVQLHLDELVADGTKTVGYVLLEKAFAVENLSAMQTLLNAEANIFELPDNNEEPFLANVLQSKGDLKRMVVDYIREQQLVERASEFLAPYPNLIAVLKELKTHLDEYSSHLVKKDNRSFLLLLAKEVLSFGRKILGRQNPSDKRGKECAKIYLDLEESLKVIKNTEEVTYSALRQVQIIMQRVKEDSMKALRGFWDTSYLHEEVIEVVNRFDEALEASKEDINDKKDEEISQLHENRKRERAEAQEKKAKLETENAKIKAENAEIKAENAEIKEKQREMEAKHAALEAKVDRLLKASNSGGDSKTSTSQNQERPKTRAGLFARP